MKSNTAERLVSHYGEPRWAADELTCRMASAKTKLARTRLAAVVEEMWRGVMGDEYPLTEEEHAANCDAMQRDRLEGRWDAE